MASDGTSVALTAIRCASYALMAWSLFYLAMFIGKWYESTILPNDELEMVLDSSDANFDGKPDLYIRHSDTSKFVFIGLPIVGAAALGGLYEALWKRREISSTAAGGRNSAGVQVQEEVEDRPGICAFLHNVVHYQYKPLGRFSPWLTVGEATVVFLWVIAMGSQCWQGVMNHGNHFHDIYEPCVDDPSSWCGRRDGQPGPTPNQYRLRMIAVFMGLVSSSHFAIILIPVARDSKIWSALGVPFERAVLYHAIAGHLAFFTLFLHAFLFVVHWVEYGGWKHAVEESIHVDPNTHGGVDTPMGWMALFCALPMWITSVNWVRRKYYSLFKLAHWLFIGVLVFGVMHWAGNALYFLGGLALYTMHVMSRLEGWKRWRYWNRWFRGSDVAKASPTSLVSAVTNDSYTRLVLRNPKASPRGKGCNSGGGESARGGSFVYISVPGALGTDEAHAITVALRGAPPSFPASSEYRKNQQFEDRGNSGAAQENDVFTVYIKDLGPWTKALKNTARGAETTGNATSLMVDVDGFYSQVQSLNSMKVAAGAPRVVIIAGGSGMTSLMGFIQDWCVAASEGADVPEVHVAWCCRFLSEFELVGEALPSLLACAGTKKDTHFTMSLYCSKGRNKEVGDVTTSSGGALSVTWPLDSTAYSGSTVEGNVIGTNHVAASLNHSVRALIAGLAAYAGYVLGYWEVDRRSLMNVYHEGAIIFVLMIVCIVSSLVVYDWASFLVRKFLLKGNNTSQVGGHRATTQTSGEESKMDLESTQLAGGIGSGDGGSVTFEVKSGRVPTEALLAEEAELAKKSGYYKVKVLTSGPNSLVDGVLAGAHAVDWQLFDAEAFSFEF
eukprot:g12813.t1